MFESSISQAMTLRCNRATSATDSPQFINGVFRNPNPPHDDMVEAMRKWFRGAPNREPADPVPTFRPETSDFTAAGHELDWWQETEIGGLRLVCTPARHFSGRGLLDRNRTLWAGWTEPGERALAEARRTEAQLVLPRPGERFMIDEPPETEKWWPRLPWRSARSEPIVSSQPIPVGS